MSLWGKNDQASNAPKNKNVIIQKGAIRANGAFDNTTPSAFVPNLVEGVFGISKSEQQASSGKLTSPGWVLAKTYTGPVQTITVSGGTGYTNGDFVKVSGGSVNAVAAIGTNGSGVPTSITFTNHGAGFVNTSSLTVAASNSTFGATAGTGATFSITLGGRAGRKHYETLVAMGTITGDADGSTF